MGRFERETSKVVRESLWEMKISNFGFSGVSQSWLRKGVYMTEQVDGELTYSSWVYREKRK